MSKVISTLEQEIISGKPTVIRTVGCSMEPLLYSKSTRVVVMKAEKELEVNDMPVYRRPSGQLVLHRIIKKDKDFYYIRGDNQYCLEKVPKGCVIGVVTEIFRKGMHFSVTNIVYRGYVHIWNIIYPVRLCIYKIRLRIRKR